MTARSWRTRADTDGRCTLTTTGVPSRSVAACTWAMEAAASGVCSTEAKTVESGPPSSSVRTRSTTGHGSGGDLVAAPLELGDQLGREDAVARGDDLAQLDVGRAELLGRHPQPARDAGDRRRAAAPALLQVPQPERAAEVPHASCRAGGRAAGCGAGSGGGARR